MGGAMPTLMLTSIIRARHDADVPWVGYGDVRGGVNAHVNFNHTCTLRCRRSLGGGDS